ncbi:MFS transporter [Lysinibacillus sp. KU-BSD001]|uniref:MFS transporter n=1 Tax=Lysinibacillus sp. KU-BSD001 TaxID=3141328 RepID=UPI0036EF8D6B
MKETIATNRKQILFLLFVGYILASMDRFFINYAILPISQDLALTATQTGFVLSAFFLGYALMQMPGGFLADKFGARITLICCIIAWSIFTGLSGLAWSLVSLLVIRFIFGLGEGAFIPASAKMLSMSYPMENRSRAMSLLLTAAAVAGVITPIIATTALQTLGWRTLFYAFGVVGVAVGALFYFLLKPKFVYVDNPEQPITVHEAADRKSQGKIPYRQILKIPLLWSLFIASFAVYAINWGTASWVPTYLVSVHGLDLTSLGLLQMIPAVTSIAFIIFAGYLVDKVFVGKEKLLGVLCGVGLTIIVYFMFNASSAGMFVFYQSVLPIFTGTAIVLVTTLPIKVFSQQISGSAVGIVQSGGQIAGFFAPILIGYLVDLMNGSYTGAIWMLLGCGVIYGVMALTISLKKGSLLTGNQPPTAEEEPVVQTT